MFYSGSLESGEKEGFETEIRRKALPRERGREEGREGKLDIFYLFHNLPLFIFFLKLCFPSFRLYDLEILKLNYIVMQLIIS
ncbi:MAG: hypothetical protein LBR53_07830 [Deltaproteobacteria bacterium]|jgi:hypothetical protein|nr:hypothetical protein [Deltaproteobacteria bacterium]